MTGKPREHDSIDEMLDVWAREIPDLDPLTEGIIERIQILSWNFNQSLEDNLAQSGTDRRAFALLGKLRKNGPPYRASAGKLAMDLRLSSGALTNRLDRMEAAGLIRRVPDPDDRRGTLVEPTELGLQKWDEVAGASSRTESSLTAVLTATEKERLHALLRKLMHAFPDWRQKKHAQPVADADD